MVSCKLCDIRSDSMYELKSVNNLCNTQLTRYTAGFRKFPVFNITYSGYVKIQLACMNLNDRPKISTYQVNPSPTFSTHHEFSLSKS